MDADAFRDAIRVAVTESYARGYADGYAAGRLGKSADPADPAADPLPAGDPGRGHVPAVVLRDAGPDTALHPAPDLD